MRTIARTAFLVLFTLAVVPFTPIPAAAATITVNSTADDQANDGECTLREAIIAANTNTASGAETGECPAGDAGLDTIAFNITPNTIQPGSALPTITEAVVIDGTTDPDFVATPVVELDGSGTGSGTPGLTIGAGGSTVRGLVINRFGGHGMSITAGGNTIEGNFIGTDASGTADLGNGFHGVFIDDVPSNTVGGTDAGAGNVISGNDGQGVFIFGSGATGNVLQGNRIGTDVSGTAELGNVFRGVFISGAPNNTVGGTGAGAGNVISGNDFDGVLISGSGATGNVFQGNRIGTDASGTADVGNGANGVFLSFAPGNTVGGTGAGAGNVISGNGVRGVQILGSTATGNVFQGNLIGTNAAGDAALGNDIQGIFIDGTPNNVIGGADPDAGNVISGNGAQGVVLIGSGATGNVLQGNLIGTNAAGTAAVGNGSIGVFIGDGSSNTIGGFEAGNVISGNGTPGEDEPPQVLLTNDAFENLVQGNFIGTTADGTAAIASPSDGVVLQEEAHDNQILGNVISSQGSDGVEIRGAGTTGNVIQSNLIGTDVTGVVPLPNAGHGVNVHGSATENLIGDPIPLDPAGNTIANNGGTGVRVDGAGTVQNTIAANRIFDNGALGIDLVGGTEDANGVTVNDDQDPDTGPNRLQNYPVLTSATSSPSNSTTVAGTLNSTPNATFALEFFGSSDCDPSGHGEGAQFLGTEEVTTDGDGNASFTVTLGPTLPEGDVVTATATDPQGNTSEFSACQEVVEETPGGPQADLTLSKRDTADPVSPGDQFTYQLRVSNAGPETATDVVVTDPLPSEVTFVSVRATQGTCSESGGTVTCQVGSLAPFEAARISITVMATSAGTATNTAQVTATEDDPDTSDNTATEQTTINGAVAHTLTVDVTGQGRVVSSPAGIRCPADCTETYPEGTTVQLSARAGSGWVFAGWGGDCAGTDTCTVVMSEDRNVTATFVPA